MIKVLPPKHKNNFENRKKHSVLVFLPGFTLIELMVVVSIMVILTTVLTINLVGQRAPRDLRIAENQLVSNIRQMQSNVLSSRNLDTGETVQYYLLKFDLSKPTQYTLQAVYNADISSPVLRDVQTVNFPGNMRLASSSPIVIDRSATGIANETPATCALVAFSAPFGKVLFNSNGCALVNNPSGNPPSTLIDTNLADNDDYGNIFNFITNCSGVSTICRVSSDSIMSIKLTDVSNTISKTITINGITGAVSFN